MMIKPGPKTPTATPSLTTTPNLTTYASIPDFELDAVNSYQHANLYNDCHRNRHCDLYCHYHSYVYPPFLHAISAADIYIYASPTITHQYADIHSNSDANLNADQYSHIDSHLYSNTYANENSHTDRYANFYTDIYANPVSYDYCFPTNKYSEMIRDILAESM